MKFDKILDEDEMIWAFQAFRFEKKGTPLFLEFVFFETEILKLIN